MADLGGPCVGRARQLGRNIVFLQGHGADGISRLGTQVEQDISRTSLATIAKYVLFCELLLYRQSSLYCILAHGKPAAPAYISGGP